MKPTFTAVALLGAVLGCSQPSVTSLPYDEAPASALIARIGDATFTKGDLERDVRIMSKLAEAAGYKAEEMSVSQDPVGCRREMLDNIVMREVVVQEAVRRGIVLSPQEMDVYQERFAEEFAQRIPLSFVDLMSALGKDATAFRANLRKDALVDKFRTSVCDQLAAELPPADMAGAVAAREEALRHNARAADENRRVGKLATNAWMSIRAGNDFDTVGRKLPEMRKGVSFDPNRPDNSAGEARFANGAVPPPFAIPGGIALAKARDRRHLACIRFPYQPLREVPTVDGLLKAQRRKDVDAAFQKLLQRLRSQADVSALQL